MSEEELQEPIAGPENAPISSALDAPAFGEQQPMAHMAAGAPEPTVKGFYAHSAKNPWLCPNGHLLGLIVRKKVSNHDVTRLYVLRMAFHLHQIVPETFIFAIIDSGFVACSICGTAREWRPGNDFVTAIAHDHAASRKKKR